MLEKMDLFFEELGCNIHSESNAINVYSSGSCTGRIKWTNRLGRITML